jgi:polysaccharide export outer membrane protein
MRNRSFSRTVGDAIRAFAAPKWLRPRRRAFIILAILAGSLDLPAWSATNAVPALTEGSTVTNSAFINSNSIPAAGTNFTATNLTGIVSMDSLDDTKALVTGDIVSYRVLEDREEPRQLAITELGEIEVPYAGRYVALNKTCKQLAQELKTYLEKDLYYKATVIVALDFKSKGANRESPGKVMVVGEVRSPGVYDIPANDSLTVSRAVLAAGGVNPFGRKTKVRISRPNPANTNQIKTIEVDLTEIWDKGKTFKDEKLEPGDVVTVPRSLFRTP